MLLVNFSAPSFKDPQEKCSIWFINISVMICYRFQTNYIIRGAKFKVKATESVSFLNYCMWIFLFYPWESNSYHKTSISMIFGCWHLFRLPLFQLHFAVHSIAWQEIRNAMSIKHPFLHFKRLKGEIPATFITCIQRNSHII